VKVSAVVTVFACVWAMTALGAQAAAPVVTTQQASHITSTTATLNGKISPNQTPTSYYFQYGTTTSYGAQTATQGPLSGNGSHNVSANVTGLTPNTTYHFRLVATGPGYAVPIVGADRTFTTSPPGPAGNNAVTISANPPAVTFGGSTTIAGKVSGPGKGGVHVALQADPYPYGGFSATGLTATTAANGAYSIAVTPTVNTRYEVIASTSTPVTSPQAGVIVRVKVTLHARPHRPAAGHRVRFFGTVTPAHNGRTAQIQRQTRTGRWRIVARTRLRAAAPVNGVAASMFSRRVRVRHSGNYRVVVHPRDGDHQRGTSPVRTVIVH
jgi:hypothetical protein